MEQILKRLQEESLTEYQSIPFWSWNAKLEPEELVRQIRWMKNNGMGGFFMHARSGLKTEYLSKEWMKCIEICADEAEKLGMYAWAYDENGWPSGFAGGKLLEQEANRDQYILAETGVYDAAATVSYAVLEDGLQRVSAPIDAPIYLNLYIHVSASTADILNPEVVKQFLELTHEEYKRYFGVDFSKKIKGFFTDEPQYFRTHTAYTPMIAKYFSEVYGEDVFDSLGLLFVEKKGYRSFRYRYWKAMQELMLHSFAEQVYNWCEEQGVQLTGHYVEEGSLALQMTCCAGVMPFYEFEHIPGIDWLGPDSDNELIPRQVASAATQLGRKQVLTESFGCCGWDITPRDLRRIIGFQYVNGVNLMCQHLIPYAEYGNRKYDHPAHYSTINPWVREEFDNFNDYVTRLGYLLAEGEETVNVAMLHPMRSAYFDFKRENEAEECGLANLNAQLIQACRSLSGANVAYHFLDETLLARHGFVRDGRIGCGKCSYEYLVLPTLYTMDKKTEQFLRTYVEQGGKLLLLGELPTYLEGEPYTYSYLKCNCSLDEVIAAQAYQVQDTDTQIYSTRRVLDGKSFLYVINASKEKTYTQTFVMGEGINSFVELDLNSFERRRQSLTLILKPGEAKLLFLDTKEMPAEQELEAYDFRLENAKVEFEENYLPVDFVRYSEDGVHYSEKWPVAALFQRLLEGRWEGTIYFKYEFEVRNKPQSILLRVEDCQAEESYLNGVSLMQQEACEIEEKILNYDIAAYVKEGRNEYVIKTNWHEVDF
ncbi:MAG: glycosyl hydrolase [Faecalimonas sp.]|nr:glycosyl hydrolase [Faecalimonas sp.]